MNEKINEYIELIKHHYGIYFEHEMKIIYEDNEIIYEIVPCYYICDIIMASINEFKLNIKRLLPELNIIDIDIIKKTNSIQIKIIHEEKTYIPTDITFKILMGLSYKDIKNYCSTSKEIYEICKSDIFWYNKLKTDYPTLDIKYEEGKMEESYELIYYLTEFEFNDIKNLKEYEIIYLSEFDDYPIPKSIELLTNLKYLYILNKTIKKIPDTIGNLTNLTELHIYDNKIEEIPNSIGNLTKLTELDLKNNEIKNIPHSIGNLTNLTHLYLNNNKLEEIPGSIGKLINLVWLDLGGNPLKTLPSEIKNLKILAYLIIPKDTIIPEDVKNKLLDMGTIVKRY